MKDRKLFYIVSHSLFNTGAKTNRLLCFVRGLLELGCDVTLLHSLPTEHIVFKNDFVPADRIKSFMIQPKKYTIWGRFVHAVLAFICAIRAYTYVLKNSKADENTIVISQDSYFLNKFIFVAFKSRKSIVTLKETMEYPSFLRRNKGYVGRLYSKLNFYLEAKLYDGYFAISRNLQNYLREWVGRERPVFLLPICVETSRFGKLKKQDAVNSPYIAYCGDMSNYKDGVRILLDAFEIVHQNRPDFKLLMIGSGRGKVFEEVIQYYKSLKAAGNIIFTGMISRDEMPAYLVNAEILALARPANKQAEGGLPTKLGEYLATGNPVVITDVSDISYYLKDHASAYISEPDSHVAFAEKLLEAANNPEEAGKIGKAGQRVAYEKFDYLNISRQMMNYINEMVTDKNNPKR
jgi:glycosyltransferase involved in cell wall biosynthesis